MNKIKKEAYTATTNACKLCTPLGASLVLKGIEKAMPILHGSQGCATYIRRYMISHFKEPVDIASSSFSEETAVFGGSENLKFGLENLRKQYQPDLIGVATTCLSETIGEDVPLILQDYRAEHADKTLPLILNVSTPSYTGTHMEGFHATVKAAVELLAEKREAGRQVNLLPGLASPADLRHLKDILADFGLEYVMLPDYSDTLDGALWSEYQRLPAGGTKIEAIKTMGGAAATLEFGRILAEQASAGRLLEQRFGPPCYSLGLPIGVNETDRFFEALQIITGRPTPERYTQARGRLVDAYIDGHKYVSQARAVVYGEEDLVVGLAAFLSEIGVIPVLCASGGESGYLDQTLRQVIPNFDRLDINVFDGVDFMEIKTLAERLSPDLLIGNSKGAPLARDLDIPLIRVGFPIHDQFGAARRLHFGYAGTQQLFDQLVNAIIAKRQEAAGVGYAYM